MPDNVIEPYAIPEIFVDGFTKHVSREGVMTCIGYRKRAEGTVVVIRLAWPTANTQAAINDANLAMDTTAQWERLASEKVH